MIRTPRISAFFLAFLAAAIAGAQTKLSLKVHTGKGQNGYDVNSTMISGEKDMLVIDPQFSLIEAHRLAAGIIESRKNLTTIYVTHPLVPIISSAWRCSNRRSRRRRLWRYPLRRTQSKTPGRRGRSSGSRHMGTRFRGRIRLSPKNWPRPRSRWKARPSRSLAACRAMARGTASFTSHR